MKVLSPNRISFVAPVAITVEQRKEARRGWERWPTTRRSRARSGRPRLIPHGGLSGLGRGSGQALIGRKNRLAQELVQRRIQFRVLCSLGLPR